MKKYATLTKILKQNPNLSLDLYFSDRDGGVENSREVAIYEPNPNEGKVANPHDGIDQQFYHGSRRTKRDFNFKVRHVQEGLELLEQVAKGKKDLDNTVNYDFRNDEKCIHGINPQGGIDNWIYHNYCFLIKTRENNLVSELSSYDFYAESRIICSRNIDDIDDAIMFYETNQPNIQIIQNIQQGLKIQKTLKPKEEGLIAEQSREIFSSEFINKYDSALEDLMPFDTSDEIKNALFLAMVLEKHV